MRSIYILEYQLDNDKSMYMTKSGKELYPNYKGLPTLGIQKEIFHLKICLLEV